MHTVYTYMSIRATSHPGVLVRPLEIVGGMWYCSHSAHHQSHFLREFAALCAPLVVSAVPAWNSPPKGRPRPEQQFAEAWSPSGPPRRRLWPPLRPLAPQAYRRNEPLVV